MKKDIKLMDALGGLEFDLKHLDGRVLHIKVYNIIILFNLILECIHIGV